MAQYQDGLAYVLNGQLQVVGNGTEWMYEIAQGDLFIADDDNLIYKVDQVISDTELILTEPYRGVTKVSPYSITRDFTPNIKLPLFYKSDKSTRLLLKYSIVLLEDFKFGNYLVQDNGDSVILNQGSDLDPADIFAANQETNFTFWEDVLNTITNIDLRQSMGT